MSLPKFPKDNFFFLMYISMCVYIHYKPPKIIILGYVTLF